MSTSIPTDVSQLVSTLYEQSEHFRQFVARQQENHKEYLFDDREGRYTVSAVDPNEEILLIQQNNSSSSSSSSSPTVFKVKGKATHVILRSPHPRWYDCAREDFNERRKTLQSGATKLLSSTSLMIVGAILIAAVALLWPLWDFFVEIQANEHYRALGLEPGASATEVAKAYRDAVRRLHPDKNPGCGQVCVTEMMKVKKAFEVLKGKDEASELQQQIDAMLAQIVMFLFGEAFVYAIHTGVVLSGVLRFFVLGSLDYEVNFERTQPPRFLRNIVDKIDYGTRVLLLVCAVGVVVQISDFNPVSVLAIAYSVVTKWSELRQSAETYYRYHGLQISDMVNALLLYVSPAILLHAILPRFIGPILVSAAATSPTGKLLPGFLSALEEFFTSDDNVKPHLGWSLIVCLIGISHVAAALYAAPPALGDNKTMMRSVIPDNATSVTAERADAPNPDGTVDVIQIRSVTFRSAMYFFITTVLARDLLAFGLRIPAPYRLAALAVYATSFAQMSQLPRESSLVFDVKFRKAEDAAKRRAEMFRNSNSNSNNNNNNQNENSESSESAPTSPVQNSNNNTNNASTATNTTKFNDWNTEGNFDFLNNDLETSNNHNDTSSNNTLIKNPFAFQTFRMNDQEKSIIAELDQEVPCWLEICRFDNFLTVRSQDIASESKFNNVLAEMVKRDMKLEMKRPRGQGSPTMLQPLFQSLEHQQQQQGNSAQNQKDKNLSYGAYRANLISKLMSHAAEKFWDEEFSSFLSFCFFWIFAAVILVILHSPTNSTSASSGSQHVQIKAAKLFNAETSFAKVYDLNIQQQMGFTMNNCDESRQHIGSSSSSLLNNNNLQRSRNTKATLCRSLLVPDVGSRSASVLAANMLFNTEGYDPRVVIYAEDTFNAGSTEEEAADREYKRRSQVDVVKNNNNKEGDDESEAREEMLKRKASHQQQRLSEKQKKQRSQHGLSLKKRKDEEKASMKKKGETGVATEDSAASWFTDVPFFGDNRPDKFGGSDPSNPTQGEFEDFMKFARELERRQRDRGYRPKPMFRGKSTTPPKSAAQINSAKRNSQNLRLGNGAGGKGSKKSQQQPVEDDPWKTDFDIEKGNDGDDDSNSDGAHLMYAGSASNDPADQAKSHMQMMKNQQVKLMHKMHKWIEGEVKAGRMHLDWRGKVVEQDHDSLIEFMMENDETWEPDPHHKVATGSKNERLGGPAADELRRLRGGESNNNNNKKNNNKRKK